jgi:hypothetical protein
MRPVNPQMTMTPTAQAKAQGDPSTVEDLRAATWKASRARQKKSRSSDFFPGFVLLVFLAITIIGSLEWRGLRALLRVFSHD